MNLYLEVTAGSNILDMWKMLAKKYNRKQDASGNIPMPVFEPTVAHSGNPMLQVNMVSKMYINKTNDTISVSIDSKFMRGRPSYKEFDFVITDLRPIKHLYISHGG